MFGLFYSLVLALFKGTWVNYSTSAAFDNISAALGNFFRPLSYLFQSFGLNVHTEGLTDYSEIIDTTTAISDNLSANAGLSIQDAMAYSFADLISGVIATITIIGIILVTIRAVKSIFRVFLIGRLS